MREHLFPYEWTLKDAIFTKDKGKVFSCFSGGGGSSMGYKLAGFDVIGCNEIDPRMMYVYCKNLNPRLPYLEPIQAFKERTDLPEELYNLDILDGSPPCSSFSMAGVNGGREALWGKKQKFREGQAEQVLDTLFFDFIDLAKKLQPKVVVAENVRGLVLGEAKEYLRRIYEEFDKAGYYVRHWLLAAKHMGVPQIRKRVFFVCLRKDLAGRFLYQKTLFEVEPAINMTFFEPIIPFGAVADYTGRDPLPLHKELMNDVLPDEPTIAAAYERKFGKVGQFNAKIAYDDQICPTQTAHPRLIITYTGHRALSKAEVCKICTFPMDYDFGKEGFEYVCGMSVPPVMMAQVATRIYDQWIKKF